MHPPCLLISLTACAFFGTASEEVKIKDQLAASFEGAADVRPATPLTGRMPCSQYRSVPSETPMKSAKTL